MTAMGAKPPSSVRVRLWDLLIGVLTTRMGRNRNVLSLFPNQSVQLQAECMMPTRVDCDSRAERAALGAIASCRAGVRPPTPALPTRGKVMGALALVGARGLRAWGPRCALVKVFLLLFVHKKKILSLVF